jgi:hypothetical protein
MTRLRRSAGRLALALLLCQATALSVTATVLALGLGETLLECTCGDGDHAMCPMHHHQRPGSKRCFMRSADADGTALLTSIFGATAAPPSSPPLLARHALAPATRVRESAAPPLIPVPPDPPPPRA